VRLIISCPAAKDDSGGGGIYSLNTESGEIKRRTDGHSIALIRYKGGFLYITNHTELRLLTENLEETDASVLPIPGGRYHDLLATDNGVWIVDTTSSRIVLIDKSETGWQERGALNVLPKAVDKFDAMHLNCIHIDNGTMYATAYGLYDKSCEWRRAKEDNGVLLDIKNQMVLLSGLAKPHTPRINGNSGVICNSSLGELIHIKSGKKGWKISKRVKVGNGFTRGLLAHDGGWFVGLSNSRYAKTKQGCAQVCYVKKGKVRQRWDLPSSEIYDILA
jgi:hypothetical protein